MRPPEPLFSWKSIELMKLPVRLVIYSLMPAPRGLPLGAALKEARD
jgi:hypothetical protein